MRRYLYKAYDNFNADNMRKGSIAVKGLAYCNALFEVELGIQTFTTRKR
jgi:hypothetical protein